MQVENRICATELEIERNRCMAWSERDEKQDGITLSQIDVRQRSYGWAQFELSRHGK